jgi:hypothetical protein
LWLPWLWLVLPLKVHTEVVEVVPVVVAVEVAAVEVAVEVAVRSPPGRRQVVAVEVAVEVAARLPPGRRQVAARSPPSRSPIIAGLAGSGNSQLLKTPSSTVYI